jgi:hypothetical protein
VESSSRKESWLPAGWLVVVAQHLHLADFHGLGIGGDIGGDVLVHLRGAGGVYFGASGIEAPL